MFVKWIQRASRTKRVGRALQTYLWWGVLVRGLLLLALGALLLAEGNFLAEWLLASRLLPSTSADVEEYTTISYVVLAAWLGIGIYLRWRIVRAMKAAPEPTSDEGETQNGDASVAGSDSPTSVRRSADGSRPTAGDA